jgi:hypothetical protein
MDAIIMIRAGKKTSVGFGKLIIGFITALGGLNY